MVHGPLLSRSAEGSSIDESQSDGRHAQGDLPPTLYRQQLTKTKPANSSSSEMCH